MLKPFGGDVHRAPMIWKGRGLVRSNDARRFQDDRRYPLPSPLRSLECRDMLVIPRYSQPEALFGDLRIDPASPPRGSLIHLRNWYALSSSGRREGEGGGSFQRVAARPPERRRSLRRRWRGSLEYGGDTAYRDGIWAFIDDSGLFCCEKRGAWKNPYCSDQTRYLVHYLMDLKQRYQSLHS